MNNFDLFEAIGGIDSSLIEKCEKERIPSSSGAWVRWGAIAACFCIVLACVICVPLINQTSPANPGPNSPSNVPTSPDGNHLLFANELEKAPSYSSNTIALNQADFTAMTEKEMLDYYGIQIAIEGAVPDLKPQSQTFGIYKNAERGVYYDHNTFAYLSPDHSQRLEIAVGKVTFPPTLAVHDEVDRTLRQSEIHGIGITVFSYTDSEGVKCYHTEISNNGIAYSITSAGLTQKTYEAAVASLISDNFIPVDSMGSASAHTVTGIVDGVDETANLITVQSDGAPLTVYLAKKEAGRYSVGDKVEISYVGNPITLCTIWKQQLSSIVIHND